jgi:[NiFe] hydrogenase diaphorase moiety large subunit
MENFISTLAKKYNKDSTRLLDIFWEIQDYFGYVSDQSLWALAREMNSSVPELKDTLSFYHFFHNEYAGKHKIFIDTSAMARIKGSDKIVHAFEKILGCKLGEVDPTGEFGLFETSCIGMSDQLPAALINGRPITNITQRDVITIIEQLKNGEQPESIVSNQVHSAGPFLLSPYALGMTLNKLKHMTRMEVLDEVIVSGLRGRGGAGYPTGRKWQLCSAQRDTTRYIVCNADEGEPGTFKDRFLLTEHTDLLIEGMIVAAFACGAQNGIIYLRAEYRYLLDHIQSRLHYFRTRGYLGKTINDIQGFHFDIRVQLGAGAYVVGEETAMLESLEGKRGEPRIRPPYPIQKGFLGHPTVVNNVETLCSAAKIIQFGPNWYREFGTADSHGTKLLSVSGDSYLEGIFEVEWGITIEQLMNMIKAKDAWGIQIGGPSGIMLNTKYKTKKIAFEDIPTGGSTMVFNRERDLLGVVEDFTRFFVNESCGCCVPCRAGNILFLEQIQSIRKGDASTKNIEDIKQWQKLVSQTSRCGLGQTCANPILTTLQSFPYLFEEKIAKKEPLFRQFDVEKKVQEYEQVVKEHEQKKS